jgi:hypothetical protein
MQKVLSNLMPEFNWVRARAECSIINAFMRLKLAIRKDVDTANEIFRGTGTKFEIVHDATSFTVYQETSPPRSISFSLNDVNSLIEVGSEKGTDFSVAITLNKDRQCNFLLADGEELDEWQFRRKALEKFFFSPSGAPVRTTFAKFTDSNS